jgi:WD40 repeat protein
MDRILLGTMHHTVEADHRCGNRQGCLGGTRGDILQQLDDWLEDTQGQRVFWLNGLAGTGKSTITQTFAEITFAEGKLGASFFCSRGFKDRSDLQAIFPTLAFQLAYQYPLFREELLKVLRANPGIGCQSLCSQLEKVIVGPFKATQISTLIIIDALDECRDEEPASAILSMLSRYVGQMPNIKFFITGRPEPRIRSGFRLKSLVPITEVLKLHEVKSEVVNSDIGLFFRTRLTNLAKTRSDYNLTEDWPSSSDIEILCKKAAGFFIYASTVVKFVTSKTHTPVELLNRITSFPQTTSHEGRSGIDLLYTQVLEQAVDDVDADNKELCSRFKTVVGTLLLLFNPLSVKALSDLLRVPNTPTALRPLHSLLLIPDNTEDPIHIFHKSFPDFLTDPKRCEDQWFYVDPTVHHTEILLSCLSLMRERLRRNICNLDDHTVLSEVKDLPTHLKTHIGDALGYACQFWTRHLVEIPSSSCDELEEIYKAIDGFFTTCFLSWIEVLSLTGSLNIGVYALNDVQKWYMSVSYVKHSLEPVLMLIQTGVSCKWAHDGQRVLLGNFDTLQNSPSKIYHSALPFSPSSSWLKKCYSAELTQGLVVIKGLSVGWGSCSRTVILGSELLALAYWKDTAAVGSKSGDIIILNAITGSQVAVFSGHTDWVRSITFSSDGTLLVSGSDDETLKLWDIQTGGVVKTFHGHTHYVYSVSISSNHTAIASGSGDKTIRLWDIQTGECCHIINQEQDVVYVSFSPTNSQHLISISGGVVHQWDIDGHQIEPTYQGFCAAFSLDGTHLALCKGGVTTVQNSNSGVIVAKFPTDKNPKSCCFSPNGRLVAVAAGATAYVWEIIDSDPHLIETFTGHASGIISLTFSSSSSIISASYDDSIKFWQIGTPSTDLVTNDPMSTTPTSASIESVSLQAENAIAISSDSDGVVKTWDLSTGLCKASFQTPVNARVSRDAQMIDGSLIVVWLGDKGIHIWDTKKGQLLRVVEADWAGAKDLRISGDGSKVFLLIEKSIQAWSVWTGEAVGGVELEDESYLDLLRMGGSRICLRFPNSLTLGWDFGASDSSPVPLPDTSLERPCLEFIGGPDWLYEGPSWIKDTATGKEVFQLSGRYATPSDVQWDGQYLVAGYKFGEVLILDFVQMLPQ